LIGNLFVTAILLAAPLQGVSAGRDKSGGEALLKPITLQGSSYEIRSGTIEVWENHDTKAGRRISLKVIVIPAMARDPNKAPLFPLSGGPGVAATASAREWLKDFDLPHCIYQDRDVVLVDQRGTGESNPLVAPVALMQDAPLQGILSTHDQPADVVMAFRRELEKFADLTQYGTSRFAEDLEEVRR